MCTDHQWINNAVRKIEADFQRSADTHLFKLDLPSLSGIDIYLKDESTHPTGSLKHRLARSLFLYAICNGWIGPETTVIEASSGSTAVSEAYFARLLGLPFIAVMPKTTACKKIEQIEFYGGKAHLVERSDQIYDESRRLAKELNGHYMDQFTYAERATDWRGNNNIANSIFSQMKLEDYPTPSWVVMSPGTGGTSATIGRFIRYQKYETKLCVADPENSVFYDAFHSGNSELKCDTGSKIEGIGRPRVEPSFIAGVVDEMRKIPDKASVATAHWISQMIGRKVGASTGTNLYAVLQIACEMKRRGESGSIVTLLCDSGDRYLDTYYDMEWVKKNIGDIQPYIALLETIQARGCVEPDCCELATS